VIAWLGLPAAGFAAATVIFVRHGEKASVPAKDPPLTPAGQKRAGALATTLADVAVKAIFVTNTKRTQQTAKPLADRLHLQPRVIDDAAALLAAIKQTDGVVVVVGHTNTIPDVILQLGGPKLEIKDSEYDNLLVLTPAGASTTLLRLHYGAPRATAAVP